MTVTQQASMRWRLIVYKNENPYPLEKTADEASATVVELGVRSISFERSKSSPEGIASVSFIGHLNPALFQGNWVVIRSRVGEFTQVASVKDSQSQDLKNLATSAAGLSLPHPGLSATTEGIPRFIGQIESVQSTYSARPDGLILRSHEIRIREWSHVYRQTIKYDLFDLAQNLKTSALSAVEGIATVIGSDFAGVDKDPIKGLLAINKAVINPFEYLTVALAMVGGLSETAAKRMKDSNSEVAPALNASKLYANIATRMPAIPKSLLLDMGLGSDAKPDNPFSAKNPFALILLGNQKQRGFSGDPASLLQDPLVAAQGARKLIVSKNKGNSIVPKYADAPEGTFNGVFDSAEAITSQFKVPYDRPVLNGAVADFAQEFDLWSLISSRADLDVNELFTDIWYHTHPKDPEQIIGRPVLVLRDKPFLLDVVKETLPDLTYNWSSFDDLPKVYIPASLIVGISTNSTFVGAPNFWRVNVRDPNIKSGSPLITEAQQQGRGSNDPSQTRYGGIYFSMDSPYFSQTPASNNAFGITAEPGKAYLPMSATWYADLSIMIRGWYSTRYYFPTGQLRIKDNNLPIMVGCNIVFKISEDTSFVAHVDRVSFDHTVSDRGDRTTSTTIGFSYLSGYDIGAQAYILGPETIVDLFVVSRFNPPDAKSSFLKFIPAAATAALKTAKKALSIANNVLKATKSIVS